MEKIFKNRKSGELAYYKDGIFKQGNCSVEIGVEPSSEFWEKAFKTEDGEIKFCGDSVAWYILDSYRYMLTLCETHYKLLDGEGSTYKIFSTVEKAKKYEEKHKEPILTTEDNEDIFGGESIYSVTDDFQLCYTSIATKENVQGIRVFAKRENAEEYILMNKPILSLNDLLSVWGFSDEFDVYKSSPLFQNFKNLAKTKL